MYVYIVLYKLNLYPTWIYNIHEMTTTKKFPIWQVLILFWQFYVMFCRFASINDGNLLPGYGLFQVIFNLNLVFLRHFGQEAGIFKAVLSEGISLTRAVPPTYWYIPVRPFPMAFPKGDSFYIMTFPLAFPKGEDLYVD